MPALAVSVMERTCQKSFRREPNRNPLPHRDSPVLIVH
jgi:hypothetical protein